MMLRLHKIYFASVLIFSYFQVVYLLEGRPPIQQDQGKNGEQPVPKPRKNSKELSICSRCHDMFTLSDKEFQSIENTERFCVRLLQVKRCIKKLKKDNSYCAGIAIFALDTGVFLKQRLYGCARMDINANSIVNIFKSNKKKKVESSDTCRYLQINRNLSEPRHCGMFGDPHVRTFYDVRQTCIVAGAWSLVDNNYLAVQVTNQIVQTTESTSATATSKVSVIFKETDSRCITQKIYEATSEYLPAVFKDGTKYSGPDGCRTEIQKENEDQISIKSCHINTTIIIRKIGSYLTFNIKTPFEFANKSRGLCHSGCPSSELVDSTSFFLNKLNEVSSSNFLPSSDEAMKICSEANLKDFYYDSCVFDLLTTGDKLFLKAANTAMADALQLDPKLRLRRDNSVVLQTKAKRSEKIYSNGRTLRSEKIVLLFSFMFVISLMWNR